jgi:hypothetical protein
MDLHPDVAPLAWLIGTWVGEGEGWYPTVADFAYREEAKFTASVKPFLAYSQATWALDDGRPMHGERGYLRVAGSQVELVVAHANGIVEISTGSLSSLTLQSVVVAGSPTAKDVTAIDRQWSLEDDVLHYTLGMTAVGEAHAPHLSARLRRA